MNSENKLSTDSILSGIIELAGSPLHQPDDMKLIIDSALQQNKIHLLEELSFHAKFSDGLLRVIQRKDSTIDENYFLKAVEEFQGSIKIVMGLLTELLAGASGFIQSILNEKYLQLSQTSLANLNSLCADLSYLKLYFNDLRSQNS